MKPILIVCCTKGKKAETKLYKSLSMLSKQEVKLVFHENNTTGLPSIYNQYINHKTLKKHDIVCFIHDDVYVDDLRLKGKLYNCLPSFDIVGLAGCLKPILRPPILWHRMSTRENQRGYVMHSLKTAHDEPGVMCSSFGYTPSRVVMIDGLFMAVNIKRAVQVEWKFNEAFTFHHYDIASCLDANKKQLRIGVTPINVIHDSPGLRSLDDIKFKQSEQKFLELYT